MADITGSGRGTAGGSGTLEPPTLDLPNPSALTPDQVRGRACIWCHVTLDNATAVDLGAREVDAHGSTTRWFPRGCRPCTYTSFYRAFQEHAKTCKQCATSLPWCATGQRLFGAAMKVNKRGWQG